MVTPPKSSARLTWAAALACVAAAALLAWQLSRSSELPPSRTAAAPPEAASGGKTGVDVSAFELPPAENFAEMIDRPVFTRSRRSPTAEEKAAVAGKAGKGPDEAPPAQLSLSGVLLIGNKRVALVRLDSDPKVMHLSEGQEAGGWQVERIRPDRITVRRGETASEVVLDFKRKPAAPMQAGRPGPRAGQFQRPTQGLAGPAGAAAPGRRGAPPAGSGDQPGHPSEEEDLLQQ